MRTHIHIYTPPFFFFVLLIIFSLSSTHSFVTGSFFYCVSQHVEMFHSWQVCCNITLCVCKPLARSQVLISPGALSNSNQLLTFVSPTHRSTPTCWIRTKYLFTYITLFKIRIRCQHLPFTQSIQRYKDIQPSKKPGFRTGNMWRTHGRHRVFFINWPTGLLVTEPNYRKSVSATPLMNRFDIFYTHWTAELGWTTWRESHTWNE